MNNIKKVSITLIKILLIVALVVAFNLLMMPKYINENQDGRIVAEMYREKLSADVIFIGSSTVYSGVSPVILYNQYGLASYVCATSSQTSWNSYYILQEALKYHKPSLVVFDIGFLTAKEEYAEEVSNRKAYDYMKMSKTKLDGIERAMAYGESKWSYIFPVLRYHERYKDLSIDDIKYSFYKPNVTYNGYVMSIVQSQELPEFIPMEFAEDRRLDACNAEYLQSIISLCKENGIQILLFKTPSYQSKWGVSFESDILNMAKANDIDYINFDMYTDMMGIDWMHDSPDSGGHLNLYGAEKFSYYLGNILASYYDVPDRRQDNDYLVVWSQKTERYELDKYSRIFGE